MPRPLRYSINITVDGCVDHTAFDANEEIHAHHTRNLAAADALLYGRTTYELMAFWRTPPDGGWPDWMVPFAETIGAAKKYVVSSTLAPDGWNMEVITGDLGEAVRRLKAEDGNGIGTGGVTLALALAELGLIDEYEFVVVPRIAGRGPRLFDGLSQYVDLKLVDRIEYPSGPVALKYVPA